MLANVQVRQLAGASCAGLADDDPRLIETALRHLRRIDLTGLVERMPDTLRLLGHLMRWGKMGPLQHLNSTPGSDIRAVDPACVEILRCWNQFDLRLYEEARRLFDSRLAALQSASSNDALPDAVWPIDGDAFTPDQAMSGYGWYEREHHQGQWLCWSSAPAATLSVRLPKARPAQFRCLLSHVISEPALRSLTVTLNSVPLVLRKREAERGILLESDIPPSAWKAAPDLARLEFRCPVMARPCDIDPNSPDVRSMGIALAWLKFA